MATGSARDNPRVFRWGLCGHKVFSSRLRDCPTPKGLAPPKCSGVFLLVADRTPSVIKNLHGLRGSKHRLAKHPVSCRSRLSVRYWTKPLVHGWDKQEVERIAGLGCTRQGTSRSDPCWVR